MLGENIKKLRKLKNVSIKEVADLTGLTSSYLSMLENNKRKNPSSKTLEKIAYALGVSVEEIYIGLVDENEVSKKNAVQKTLNNRDQRDIAKTLEQVMADMEDGKDGPLFYGGEMDETDKALLKNAIESALEIVKIKNKEKYTPKKYK